MSVQLHIRRTKEKSIRDSTETKTKEGKEVKEEPKDTEEMTV